MKSDDFSVQHQLIRHLLKLHDAVFENQRPVPDSGADTDDYVLVVMLIGDTPHAATCDSSARAQLQIDVWERGSCCEAGVLSLWEAAIDQHLEDFRGKFGRIYVTAAWRQSTATKPTDGIRDNALAITVIVEYRRIQ